MLSCGNYKCHSVETYRQFLNKSQTIAVTDSVNHVNFIQNSKTLQYAWNISPTNNTDVSRSLAGINREFIFPLTRWWKRHYLISLFEGCLRGLVILLVYPKILIEKLGLEHTNRHATNKQICDVKIGNIVKLHVQVQSDAKKMLLEKLIIALKDCLLLPPI